MRQKSFRNMGFCVLLVAVLLLVAISYNDSASNKGSVGSAPESGLAESSRPEPGSGGVDNMGRSGDAGGVSYNGSAAEGGIAAGTDRGTEDADAPALSEGQMQELYDSIKESVKTGYLEPNGILPERFQWPAYEVLSNGVIRDEDHAWSYFNNIALNYSQYGTLYDTNGFMYDLPEDSVRQLMDAVLDGMVEWHKCNEEGLAFQRVRDAVFPEYEKLLEHIDFLE